MYSDLNAFITIDETAALAAVRDADKSRAAGSTAPLLGVPLAIKDSYLTRGLRTTLGLETLGRFVPDEDADVVSSIKDAGGIVFGKNKSSGPGELHPQALTDPDVSVSTHPAPTVQPLPGIAVSNVQKVLAPDA